MLTNDSGWFEGSWENTELNHGIFLRLSLGDHLVCGKTSNLRLVGKPTNRIRKNPANRDLHQSNQPPKNQGGDKFESFHSMRFESYHLMSRKIIILLIRLYIITRKEDR